MTGAGYNAQQCSPATWGVPTGSPRWPMTAWVGSLSTAMKPHAYPRLTFGVACRPVQEWVPGRRIKQCYLGLAFELRCTTAEMEDGTDASNRCVYL